MIDFLIITLVFLFGFAVGAVFKENQISCESCQNLKGKECATECHKYSGYQPKEEEPNENPG